MKTVIVRTSLLAGMVAMLLQLTSCGTILYPERRGQTGGNLDPAVVVLDAIGLLFFLIPGVIAFAVDFTTGAIYLPGGRHSQVTPEDLDSMVAVHVDPQEISNEVIERVIFEQTGRRVSLNDERVVMQRLDTAAH